MAGGPVIQIAKYGYYDPSLFLKDQSVRVLDGFLWRKKRKIENNAEWRKKHLILPNGAKKTVLPSTFIIDKKSQNVSNSDYSLFLVEPFKTFKESNYRKFKIAWIVGLYIAEGSMYKSKKNNYSVKFTCSKDDKHIDCLLYALNECFPNLNAKVFPHSDSDNAVVIRVNGKDIYELLSEYVEGKLTRKRFKRKIFDLSQEEILNVLGGYFDGDGSFVEEHQNIVANNYSQDMSHQLWELLIRTGIRANLKKYKLTGDHYNTKSTNYYRILVPSSQTFLLQSYMKSEKIPSNFIPKKNREFNFFYKENDKKYYCQPIRKINYIAQRSL